MRLLARNPWLRGTLEKKGGAAHSGQAGSSTDVAGESQSTVPDQLDDDVVEQVFGELEKQREALQEDTGATPQFRVSILGGVWTQRHLGTAYDAFRGAPAKGSDAEAWCVRYHVGRSARFDVSLYSTAGAATFARAWCHKMQHFFTLWEALADPSYLFTREDIRDYVEPAEFTDLVGSLRGKAAARAQWLRDLAPRA